MESAIMSVLESPSLVRHHETFLHKSQPMFAMEFCALGSLRCGPQALHLCHTVGCQALHMCRTVGCRASHMRHTLGCRALHSCDGVLLAGLPE
eukprot:3176425-Pyramimonas_sp.AAC.1